MHPRHVADVIGKPILHVCSLVARRFLVFLRLRAQPGRLHCTLSVLPALARLVTTPRSRRASGVVERCHAVAVGAGRAGRALHRVLKPRHTVCIGVCAAGDAAWRHRGTCGRPARWREAPRGVKSTMVVGFMIVDYPRTGTSAFRRSRAPTYRARSHSAVHAKAFRSLLADIGAIRHGHPLFGCCDTPRGRSA
jgi:hypothetical protein